MIMASLLVIFPIGILYNARRRDYRFVGPYLSGANVGRDFVPRRHGAHAARRYPQLLPVALVRGTRRLLQAGLLCAGFFLIIMFGVVIAMNPLMTRLRSASFFG